MTKQEHIAETINRLCRERGMTLRALSQKSGVTIESITRLAAGQTARPRPKTVAQLCAALGVSLAEFYGAK